MYERLTPSTCKSIPVVKTLAWTIDNALAPIITKDVVLTSDAKYAIAPFRSSGSPTRPFSMGQQGSPPLSGIWQTIGVRLSQVLRNSGLLSRIVLVKLCTDKQCRHQLKVGPEVCFKLTVAMYPGLRQFTLILSLAHSTAKLLAKCLTAAFEALYGAWAWGTVNRNEISLSRMQWCKITTDRWRSNKEMLA